MLALTAKVHVRISEVGEANPHPGHLLGHLEIFLAVGSAERVRVTVLRVA